MQRFSSRSEGPESHIGSPSLGVLLWKDEPLEHLALMASGACIRESQLAIGNRDSDLKGCTQNLACSETQGRGRNLKGACVKLTC